jgi:hypothetical protein
MSRLKNLIISLLEDHHPAELEEITGADWETCFKLVHEIRKDGGFDPNNWEPVKSGDIWAIYGKTFSAEWIDEHGECLAFDTKREANEYIRDNIK